MTSLTILFFKQFGKRFLGWSLLTGCLVFLILLSLTLGIESIPLHELLFPGADQQELLLVSRIPRTISIILTGAGLSICGVILQQIAQNKFISPTTSGTLDSAKLGVLGSLLLFPHAGLSTKLIFASLICFLLSSFFAFSIIRMVKQNTVLIPVYGVMFGYILNSITNLIGVQFNIVQNMESWMVGNFSKTLRGQYEIIYILIPLFIICYFYANRFIIVGLGRDFTLNIGLNYRVIISVGLILTSIMVSTTMLAVGAIPFIDLVIPNIVSLIHGDNIRKNLPITACYGAIALLACDIIGRCIIFPYEMPSSMIIGFVGALFFLILLIKRGR